MSDEVSRHYHKPLYEPPSAPGIFKCYVYGNSVPRLQLVGTPAALDAYERRHRLVRVHIDSRDISYRHAT